MRTGELARRSGLSRDALRFFDRQGLIRPAPGSEASNSGRDCREDALITLEQIADAQAAGISIADLAILPGRLEAADPDTFDGGAFPDSRIAKVAARDALEAPPVRRCAKRFPLHPAAACRTAWA